MEISLKYGIAPTFERVFLVVAMLLSTVAMCVPTFAIVTMSTWRTVHTSFAIQQIMSQHTPTSANVICSSDDDSRHSIHWMKCVVLVFDDTDGIIWPMIVAVQKWFTMCIILIQGCSLRTSCSTIAGRLCIIVIMISHVWVQTLVNHQFYYIYYYYDISTKPRIK